MKKNREIIIIIIIEDENENINIEIIINDNEKWLIIIIKNNYRKSNWDC